MGFSANRGGSLLLGQGDTSGNYANDLYLSAFYFSDTVLSDATIAGFGGVSAAGIVVPGPYTYEPSDDVDPMQEQEEQKQEEFRFSK